MKNLDEAAQEVIADEEFNEVMETELDSIMAEKDLEEVSQRLLIYTRSKSSDELSLIPVVFGGGMPDDSEERQKVMFGLGSKLAEEHFYADEVADNPVAVIFVTEAWTIDHELEPGKRVSEHDDRKEVVVVTGMTIDGRTNVAMLNIERDSKKKLKLTLDKFMPHRPGTKSKMESNLLKAFFGGVAQYVVESRGL